MHELWALWVLGTFQLSHAAARAPQPDCPSCSAGPAAVTMLAGMQGSVADAWPEAVPLAAAANVQSATLHLIMGT